MDKKLVLLTIFIMLFGIAGFCTYAYYSGIIQIPSQKTASVQQVVKDVVTANTPTPMPFYELTIPALREKTYESSLGEQTVAYENANYTAYLTSYTSEGLKINGLLTVPKGEPPEGGWPAVVFVHGYIPPQQYETQSRYVDYVDYLASNDLVVFKIDLRGHGNSEGEPGGAYYSPDYVIDTLNARAALQTSNVINPQKVGLWGHSMAGNVLLRSIAVKPDIPAAVIWAGAGYTYLDLQEYRITDSSYQPNQTANRNMQRRQRIRETYGDPDLSKSFWQQMAPTTYLNEFTGALAVHHAVDDDVVGIDYARNLKNILSNTNVKNEIYEYPSGGHNILGSSFNSAMQRTVDFYKENLK